MIAIGFALSLLIGVSLGFFGGGGSILTVPLLVYVFGLGPKEAIASSLLIVALASSLGAFHHWRAGNADLRVAVVFGSAGMLGAFLGGRTSAYVDGVLLLLAFALMMGLTAIGMWQGRREPDALPRHAGSNLPLIAQGFAVGCATGLVGAGGGFLIVPALALWARLPMPVAVGTSLLVIVMNALAGFSGYVTHVAIDVPLVAGVSAIAIAGTFVGARAAQSIDPGALRRAFAVFVASMAGFILWRESDVWIDAARMALPERAPQVVFAALMLGVGLLAGRLSRSEPDRIPQAARAFSHGSGI